MRRRRDGPASLDGMRWPISEPTFRSDPVACRGVCATASRGCGRLRCGAEDARKGRRPSAPTGLLSASASPGRSESPRDRVADICSSSNAAASPAASQAVAITRESDTSVADRRERQLGSTRILARRRDRAATQLLAAPQLLRIRDPRQSALLTFPNAPMPSRLDTRTAASPTGDRDQRELAADVAVQRRTQQQPNHRVGDAVEDRETRVTRRHRAPPTLPRSAATRRRRPMRRFACLGPSPARGRSAVQTMVTGFAWQHRATGRGTEVQ